jgi:hypothetical protein
MTDQPQKRTRRTRAQMEELRNAKAAPTTTPPPVKNAELIEALKEELNKPVRTKASPTNHPSEVSFTIESNEASPTTKIVVMHDKMDMKFMETAKSKITDSIKKAAKEADFLVEDVKGKDKTLTITGRNRYDPAKHPYDFVNFFIEDVSKLLKVDVEFGFSILITSKRIEISHI